VLFSGRTRLSGEVLEEFVLGLGVESRGRFVEDQQHRVGNG
jgi:hypothetical protein